jgi:hypothetical protein
MCTCTSTLVVCPDALSPTPSTSSAIKTPDNTKWGPWWPRTRWWSSGIFPWLVIQAKPDNPEYSIIRHLFHPVWAGIMEFCYTIFLWNTVIFTFSESGKSVHCMGMHIQCNIHRYKARFQKIFHKFWNEP